MAQRPPWACIAALRWGPGGGQAGRRRLPVAHHLLHHKLPDDGALRQRLVAPLGHDLLQALAALGLRGDGGRVRAASGARPGAPSTWLHPLQMRSRPAVVA